MNLKIRRFPPRFVCLCALLPLFGASPSHAGRLVPAYRNPQPAAPAPSRAPASEGARLNQYQRARLESLVRASTAVTDDTLRVLAFQVQFQDSLMGGQPGSNRPQVRDVAWFSNELDHLAQYFRGASRGHQQVAWTIDDSLYTLPNRMSYYGSDTFEDKRVVELVQTLIGLADARVDFSAYDHVIIIHAGAGQETDIGGDSPIQIWSSFYDLGDIRRAQDDPASPGIATTDQLAGQPFSVNNFSIVPSHASQDFATVGTLGIWSFQIGSRLGLVPTFDSTPGGVPDSQGVGGFCLMSYGLFNVNGFVPAFPCAFNRILAGWLDPVVIDARAGAVTARLSDVNTGLDTDTLCVKVPITESEYYLVVNREHDANFDSLFTFGDVDMDLIPDNDDSLEGAEFDFFLTDLTNPYQYRVDSRYPQYVPPAYPGVLFRYTGSGVYIWHVDERVVAESVASGFLPNDYAAQKGIDLEEADGVQDMDRQGPSQVALGSFFDSYRVGEGNETVLGPGTRPASLSNSGVPTGIEIETLSRAGLSMRVSIRRELSYSDTRTRWPAASPSQAPSVVDLDGAGDLEIVALSDDAGVYVFNPAGAEWVDGDADPATIAPYIAVPGETWTGPPAFANLDGGPDMETVAIAKSGHVYAWKSDGSELADGDANPGTQGILYSGLPMLAPPMLVDVTGDGVSEIAIAERVGGTVRISFVNAAGAITPPSAPAVAPLWPLTLSAQRVKALGWSRMTDSGAETFGVVASCVDSVVASAFVSWTPAATSGAALAGPPVASIWTLASGGDPGRIEPSAPAVGDIDGDNDDELVVALADGRVFVLDPLGAMSDGLASRESGQLRGTDPSDPVLGDVDGDGTLEIALWDSQYRYLLKSNARTMLEWPVVIRPESSGEAPAISVRRAMESALIADIDGDGHSDALFPLDDGTLVAASSSGAQAASFPRVGPAGMGAAPSLAEVAGGWRLVALASSSQLAGVDAVTDSVSTRDETILSIQSLGGAVAAPAWPVARGDLARSGRASGGFAPATASAPYDAGSFIIYPNPVKGDEVHARVSTNVSARVQLSIYTVEGQEAVSRSFDVNPNSLPGTPFDEAVDVAALKSGVYLLRLRIDGGGGGGSLVKPFAIRR